MQNHTRATGSVGFAEFLAIVALTILLVAMSIDAMLPALHAKG
jgi:hypothetical protein